MDYTKYPHYKYAPLYAKILYFAVVVINIAALIYYAVTFSPILFFMQLLIFMLWILIGFMYCMIACLMEEQDKLTIL